MAKKCRICGGQAFKDVLDMGDNTLVNNLVEEKDLDKTEATYPLLVEQCQDCFLVQIVNPVDTRKIYQAQDYLYFTGEMPTTNEYFKEFAVELKRYLKNNSLVIEIGSNDGTVLSHFKGYKILGIDPSTNVVIRALAKGIPTLSSGFNEQNAKNIKKEFGLADLIGGANCIAHIDDIHSLMRGIKELLSEEGVFWVECNYWGGMVKNKNYSLVYHDHYSYFSLKSWFDLAESHKLEVFDAYVTPAQGGSLRVFLSKKRARTPRLIDLLENEVNLNNYETAKRYGEECREEAKKLKEKIEEIKKDGKSIAGYGAAAKGFSILKLAGIDETHIDYFVDDSPAKQGKYTPVSHIPVVARKDRPDPDYFFITAPNYEKEIIEKEKDFKGQFITSDCRII